MITKDQLDVGLMAKLAADEHAHLMTLDRLYEGRGRYTDADELRSAMKTALANIGDFAATMHEAEQSREYTPAGLAARRKTLREPLVLAAERHDQRAQALERSVVKTAAEAWDKEIAPARDALDAMQLTHMQAELRALDEPMRVPVLNDPGPLGRLARRAAFGFPTLRPFVHPDAAARIQKEVTSRLVELGDHTFLANEHRSLARRYRKAAGLEEPPIMLGGSAG